MDIKEVLRSKPVAIGSGVVAFVGTAALAVGLIAMFGRFQAAHAVSQYVGNKGQVALIASGGAAFGVASVVLVANIYFNRKATTNEKKTETTAPKTETTAPKTETTAPKTETTAAELAEIATQAQNRAADAEAKAEAARARHIAAQERLEVLVRERADLAEIATQAQKRSDDAAVAAESACARHNAAQERLKQLGMIEQVVSPASKSIDARFRALFSR